MISSAVFVTLLLASAVVQAQPPIQAVFGESTTTALTSQASGWWFFDVTIPAAPTGRAIKVTRLGARTAYSGPSSGQVQNIEIYRRSSTSRGNERNGPTDANWVQVSGSSTNYPFNIITPGAPISTNAFVVVDVDDFVLTPGINGLAIHIPTLSGTELHIIYDGDLATPTTPYTYVNPAGTTLITVSTATTTQTFDSNSLVQGYHSPNLFLEFTDPDLIGLSGAAAAASPVCAGDGQLLNFTATVTNNGFTALEPIVVKDVLTTNYDVNYLENINRFSRNVVGCAWKIQEYTTPTTTGTIAEAEAVIAGQNPTSAVRPIIKARSSTSTGLEAGDLVNTTTNVFYQFGSVASNHVVQMRTSVAFPASSGPYQIGILSADFIPIGATPSIWVYVDNVLVSFGAAPLGLVEIPGATTDDSFYGSASNPILGNGQAYNVRVVINMPSSTDNYYDLEIYARDVSDATMGSPVLDQSWFPLQASQATVNPDSSPVTISVVPAGNGLNAEWTIDSLCVGGNVQLTTQLTVDSSAPDDLTVTDTFRVDTTQPTGSSATITTNPAIINVDVDRCSELTITKTTLCDRTELSQWQVEFWQSDAQTVGNGTSPFYDFDTTIASSTPTNTLSVDLVNFGDDSTGFFSGDETTFEEISGDSSMAASQFFVRARAQILVDPAGFYTFYVASNRGVRLTIDGKNASILHEPFGIPTANAAYENFYTASLTAGVHDIEIVMYDTVAKSLLELAIAPGAEPLANAAFQGTADTPSLVDTTAVLTYDLLKPAPVCLLACNDDFFSGFTVSMWQWNELINVAFENSSTLIEAASPFDQLDATVQFLEPNASACGVQYINYQSGDGNTVSGGSTENVFGDDELYPLESVSTPIDNFFFRATGRFFIGVSGIYTIATNTNRGVRVTIDGVVRIRDEPESYGDFQNYVSLPFAAGEHTIIVDHYDSLRVSRIEVGIAAGAVTSINANNPFNDQYLSFTLLGSALECQLEPQFDALETVVAGQNFTYTVTVNNNGPSDADVTVADVLSSPGVTPAVINAAWIIGVRTDDASATTTQTALNIGWDVVIPAVESRRLFIDIAVPANTAALDNGANAAGICNTATATASAGQIGTAIVKTCETIIRLVDLETSIVFSDAEVTANDAADTLTATVTITNNGPSNTAGATVPLTIVTPAGVTFTTSGNATLSAGVLTVGALPSGSTVVLTITFDATAATAVGPITIASGDFTLTNAALERLIRTCNDEQNAAAAVIRQIDLVLDKVAVTSNLADNTNAVAGQDTITYTITASNKGPSTLPAGARIIDTFYGDTTGLSVNSGLTTFTPGGSYVTTLCGAVDTTTWSIKYWNVNNTVAFGGEFPFADIDRIHADSVAPDYEEERDVLSIAEDDDDTISGFESTRWPTAAQTGSVDFNTITTFYATATTQLDVRSAGHFTFAANVRTGIRLSIAGGSTSTKIVLQPPFGQYQVFHTLALAVGVYDITVDYYFYTASTEQVLQVFIADGSRFTYPVALGTITPEFYRLLTPADCEYACDLAPDRDAIDTEWRTRFWAFDDTSVDNATSVFERLDQIIGANAAPLATAQTATPNFVRPENTVWGEPAPLAGSFFSRSVGQIWIAETGLYAFFTERPTVDLAGSRLFVDGNVLTAEVEENQPLGFNYYVIELAKGAHDVVFDAAVPCQLNNGNCQEIDLEIARQTTTFAFVNTLNYDNLRTSTYCQVDYWVLPEIAAGESATLVLVIDVGTSAVSQAALIDTVHYPRLELPAENQLISENDDSDSASVSISRELELTLEIVATPQEVVAGAAGTADEVLFAVTVGNSGPSDTAGVKVRVTFPSTATVTGPTFDDATDVTSSFNATTLVWTTKSIAALSSDVLELRFTFGPQASCDVDFEVRVEIIELVDADETLRTALPIEDTVAVNVIRRGTLVLALTNTVAAVSASDVADQCSTYTASVQNTGPSYVSDATAQLALTLPLGAYVKAVSNAVQSSGPGSVLNVALPTLVPNAAASTFTFDLCASSETPDAAVIDATLSVVLLPDNLCEELTQTPADARNVVVTREAALLEVAKSVANPGHSVVLGGFGTIYYAIAGEYAGNAPFIVELSNDVGESDVDGITVESTIDTSQVAAELHRVVLQPLDVGWTVEAFLPGQTDAGDLTTFPVDAPFVTFIADSLDYSGSVPAELAAAATTANGFYLRASAPIVIQSDAARVYTVTSTGDVELTIDGNVVVNGQSLALTTGVHQAVVRVAQAADLAAFNLHVRAASAPLLGEDLATFQAGTPTSTWTIPTLRAGHSARLYEFFTALTAVGGTNGNPVDTGKLFNTAVVNEPTSPATLNGDGYDHDDSAFHFVHQHCVRGVDVVLELSREALVAYAGDNDFQHFVRVTNRGFVQCNGVFVDITGTSSNAGASAILLVSPQNVNLASGASVLLPVHFKIDGDADATGAVTTTAKFTTASPPALAVNPLHAFPNERAADNTLQTISTPIDRLSLINIAVVRTTNTQSDDVANNGGANPAITYDVTFTNNGPSPARYPLVIFRCPTATPTNLNTECEKIRVNRRADADKLLTVGESRTVAVEIAASDIGVGGSIFRSFFFAPKSIDGLDGTIEYSPVPIQVDTNVAPFTIGLEITAFEEIEKKRNVDAWASSSSSESSSSSSSSSSSDDTETRLIFVEVHNLNAIVNAENVAVLIQFGAHDKIEHAEALLTQSSRHDSVVNNGGPSFTWTIGELAHGARARIALKLRASSHLSLSAEIVAANACLATSATCEIAADLSIENPFTKLF